MLDLSPLSNWFQEHKRELPWRQNPTPYGVWVSEVMLQQTQVAVVIPYYLNWMKLFPSVEALAKAPLEGVIKAWEGLGYYSRARNLHQGAKVVLEKHGGILPSTHAELLNIKGLGEYTVGAILSFAFQKRAAAVDGNVLRVIARLTGLEEDIALGKTKKHIHTLCENFLPERAPWEIAEALIELGALVCTKKPSCAKCPLRASCKAFQTGKTDVIPYKSVKVKREKLTRTVVVIASNEGYLIRQVPPGEIMEGLFEFPYFEGEGEPLDVAKLVAAQYAIQVDFEASMGVVRHGFTRYQATLVPLRFRAMESGAIKDHQWVKMEELVKLPFSSGHRKIFQELEKTQGGNCRSRTVNITVTECNLP